MPLERAVAWGPVPDGSAPPSGASAPGQIFFMPNALREMTSCVVRDGAGSLGYFAGRRFRDTDSKEPWVLAEVVIPVVKQSTRSPIPVLLDATIEQARAQARAIGREVVGWYHSATCGRPVLNQTHGAAHERHFATSNSFMFMIAIARHERQAALFRPALERGSVPFYELLESDASLDNGAPSTAESWSSYLTIAAVSDEGPVRTSGSQWNTVGQPPPVEDEPPITSTSEAPRSGDTRGGSGAASGPSPRSAARGEAHFSAPRPNGAVPETHTMPPPSRGTRPPRGPGPGFGEPPRGRAAPDAMHRDATPPAPEQPDAWMPNFSSAGVPEEPVAVPPTTARDRAGERVRERRPSPSAATSRKRLSKKEPAAFRHRAPRRRFSLKPLLIGGLATAVVAVVVAVAGRYRPAPSDRGEAAPGPLAVAADLAESEVLRYRSSTRSFDDGRVRCVELGRGARGAGRGTPHDGTRPGR